MRIEMRVLCAALVVMSAAACEQIAGLSGASQAKKRVEVVLAGIRDGGRGTGNVIQTAICRWDRDVVLIHDRDTLEAAMDAFDIWRGQAGIYPTLKGFTIHDEVEGADEGDPDGTYYVPVTLDGKDHWIRVPPKARMSWAD